MTHEQIGVIRGAVPALLVTVISLGATYYLAIQGMALRTELPIALGVIVFPLWYCIAHIGNKRFMNESVIGGAAYDTPESIVAIDKAVLQNTLEQTILAFGAYSMLSAALPELSTAFFTVLMSLFIIGRIFFIAGYKRGAGGRAFGFGLTAYPTVVTLIGSLILLLVM